MDILKNIQIEPFVVKPTIAKIKNYLVTKINIEIGRLNLLSTNSFIKERNSLANQINDKIRKLIKDETKSTKFDHKAYVRPNYVRSGDIKLKNKYTAKYTKQIKKLQKLKEKILDEIEVLGIDNETIKEFNKSIANALK